jgi:thiol-disulfide isomerase/thioredoxin
VRGHDGLGRALIGRRTVLAVGATLLAGVAARKFLAPWALAEAGADEGPDGFKPLRDIVAVQPAALPAMNFATLDGGAVTLASFRGKPLVLNFWATWCAPCVAELPQLDQLAAGGTVRVVAVSVDRGGATRVRPFLAAHAVPHLTVLLDSGSTAVHAAGVVGFPTTLILDAEGRVRGRLEGPAAWSEAAEVIKKLVT